MRFNRRASRLSGSEKCRVDLRILRDKERGRHREMRGPATRFNLPFALPRSHPRGSVADPSLSAVSISFGARRKPILDPKVIHPSRPPGPQPQGNTRGVRYHDRRSSGDRRVHNRALGVIPSSLFSKVGPNQDLTKNRPNRFRHRLQLTPRPSRQRLRFPRPLLRTKRARRRHPQLPRSPGLTLPSRHPRPRITTLLR